MTRKDLHDLMNDIVHLREAARTVAMYLSAHVDGLDPDGPDAAQAVKEQQAIAALHGAMHPFRTW